MFKMLGPEHRAILYSKATLYSEAVLYGKIRAKQIMDHLERALQKDMIYEAFLYLSNEKYIQLNNVYKVLDDILFRKGVKVVAKLFDKLNQRQRHSLYEKLTYDKNIRKILDKSVIDDNSFEAILYLSDHHAIELEDMYNYLTGPKNSPEKISPSRKRKRSSNSNSSGPTQKRRRHPSPRGYSPTREIPMSQFGTVRPGNGSTKEEEASARKLFFPSGKTQTTITSFFKKPPTNKRGIVTRGPVTNNSNNED
jgi:hypothetical protein